MLNVDNYRIHFFSPVPSRYLRNIFAVQPAELLKSRDKFIDMKSIEKNPTAKGEKRQWVSRLLLERRVENLFTGINLWSQFVTRDTSKLFDMQNPFNWQTTFKPFGYITLIWPPFIEFWQPSSEFCLGSDLAYCFSQSMHFRDPVGLSFHTHKNTR